MCWLITFTGKPESVCSGHTAFQHSLHRSTEDWECHCTLQRQLSLAVGDFAVLCSCICPAVTVQDLGTVESCILVALSSSATTTAPQPCYFCQAAHFAFAARAFVLFLAARLAHHRVIIAVLPFLSTKNYSCYF